MRTYLAVRGGFDAPLYLGSRSTFSLGGLGGPATGVLKAGDTLRIGAEPLSAVMEGAPSDLVTTKYNPARTWTPENAVGIGGAYLCVYGMEGPGGYQFVGRTVQMWNSWKETPWLLRFFDQIRFYPV